MGFELDCNRDNTLNNIEEKNEKYEKNDVRNAINPFMVSMIFVAIFTIIATGAVTATFLTKYLHTTDKEYAIIMSCVQIGIIGTFIGTYIVARSGKTKPIMIPMTILGRSLYAIIGILLLITPSVGDKNHPTMLIYLVGILILLAWIINNIGASGWSTWMADLIPKSIAGSLFGIRARLSFVMQLVVGLSAPFMISCFHHSRYIYAIVFIFCGLCGVLDIIIHSRIREVKREVEKPLPTVFNLITIPWHDQFFRKISLYLFVSNIGLALMGVFVWRFCYAPLSENGLSMDFNVANLIVSIIPLLCMVVTSPIWGRAIDRFGAKIVMMTAIFSHTFIPLAWSIFSVHHVDRTLIFIWLIIVAVFSGCTWSGVDQPIVYMQMKIFPNKLKVAYITLSALCVSAGAFLGVMACGYLTSFFSLMLPRIPSLWWVSEYQPLFLLATIVRFGSFVYLKTSVKFPVPTNKDVTIVTVYKYVFYNACRTISYWFEPIKRLNKQKN